MTPHVHTVLGPVAPNHLGRTLPHEHLLCDFYRVTRDLNQLLNDAWLATDELVLARDQGVEALVELTTPDMGRDVVRLRAIAQASSVHVVAATGWYRQPFYPPTIDRTPTDVLAAGMIEELTVGVRVHATDTDAAAAIPIPVGVIGEIGADLDVLTAQEERVLRAAARAQRATGAPLFTHASLHPVGLAQLDVLEDEGVDPSRVVIGHADTYLDPGYHREILERGAYLAFDTIARNHMNPDDRRAASLVDLLDAGWSHRLLLSSDRCHRSDLVAFRGPGYGVVFGAFVPRLQRMGVDAATLDQLTITNPATVLAW